MQWEVREKRPRERRVQGQRKCMERRSDEGPGRAAHLTAGTTAEAGGGVGVGGMRISKG